MSRLDKQLIITNQSYHLGVAIKSILSEHFPCVNCTRLGYLLKDVVNRALMRCHSFSIYANLAMQVYFLLNGLSGSDKFGGVIEG